MTENATMTRDTEDGVNSLYPFNGYDDNDQPVWADVGSLRYEHGEGFFNGFMLGFLVGMVAIALALVVGTVA